jgi:hypothetical protein
MIATRHDCSGGVAIICLSLSPQVVFPGLNAYLKTIRQSTPAIYASPGGKTMQLFVTASDRQEIFEVLTQEGVAYQERLAESVRELGTGSYEIYAIQANLPEVKTPPEYSQGDIGARAFRLPSGRLVITDQEGNLEQVTAPLPRT